jgi:CHAT domain-containing protein
MDAFIVVASGGSEHPEYDGYLTGYEVAAIDMSGTELVVLSACETGLGAPGAWHGAYSLQRSFLSTGVRAV